MSLNRTCLRPAVVGVLVLLTGLPAFAQHPPEMKLFAPADLSRYGSGPQPNEGYFFVFDGLHWSISTPDVTTIGFPNLTRNVYYGPEDTDMVVQSNTLDTGFLKSEFTGGNRIEIGRIVDDCGWFVSTYRLNNQTQLATSSAVDMVFVDPEFGPSGTKLLEGIVGTTTNPSPPPTNINVIRDLPLTFDDVTIRNKVETWSVELNCIHRSRQHRRGGFCEWFAGVRYLEFDENFDVDARGNLAVTQQVPAILADSLWETEAENHIVGPQAGLRWFRKRGRWMLSTEGRYMAGFNSQNIRQGGTLGTQLNPPGTTFQPRLMDTTSFNHSEHIQQFSSTVELRAELTYQLTRAISFRVGWTGLWMDGIARPSNMINYEVPDMGLRTQFNDQDVLVNGVTFGVDVNR